MMPGSNPRLHPLAGVALATAGALLSLAAIPGAAARAADHADGTGFIPTNPRSYDTELSRSGRFDANIAQFFAFRSPADPSKLVLILAMVPQTPEPDCYFFAEDLTVEFHVDNRSSVTFTDGNPATETDDWMMRFGGTVAEPDKIRKNVAFKVQFKRTKDGMKTVPKLVLEGLSKKAEEQIAIFPRRDEWESPVRLNGLATVALELPLALVVTPDDPAKPLEDVLLLWATTNVPDVHGHSADHMGLPNTSNQGASMALINQLQPRHQSDIIERRHPPDLPPLAPLADYADVLIYDLSRPARGFPPGQGAPPFDRFNAAAFPNGRPVDAALRANPFAFPYIAGP